MTTQINKIHEDTLPNISPHNSWQNTEQVTRYVWCRWQTIV